MGKEFKTDFANTRTALSNDAGILLMGIGLIFSAGGVLIIGSSIFPGIIESQSNSPGTESIMGGIFLFLGSCLAFGRHGIIIDKRLNTVTSRFGFFVPFSYFKMQRLDRIDLISQMQERRNAGTHSGTRTGAVTVYPIYLMGKGVRIWITDAKTSAIARRLTEHLSDFLGVDVEESTDGVVSLRKAGTMDLSVNDRFRASNESAKEMTVPVVLESCITQSGNKLKIIIPPSSAFNPIVAISTLPGLVITGIVCICFLPDILQIANRNSRTFFLCFLGFFFAFLPVVVPPIALIRKLLETIVITVDRKNFSFTSGWPIKHTIKIPNDDVEEFKTLGQKGEAEQRQPAKALIHVLKNFVKSGGIMVRSDYHRIHFGRKLSEEENQYLVTMMMKAISIQ